MMMNQRLRVLSLALILQLPAIGRGDEIDLPRPPVSFHKKLTTKSRDLVDIYIRESFRSLTDEERLEWDRTASTLHKLHPRESPRVTPAGDVLRREIMCELIIDQLTVHRMPVIAGGDFSRTRKADIPYVVLDCLLDGDRLLVLQRQFDIVQLACFDHPQSDRPRLRTIVIGLDGSAVRRAIRGQLSADPKGREIRIRLGDADEWFDDRLIELEQ